MVGKMARRFSVMAAGAALLVAATASPVVTEAAGLLAGPSPAEAANQGLAFKPDMQVTARGVEVDGNGNVYYKFAIKNVGLGLAKGVKVTKLSQVKEITYPQKVKSTVTVLEYDAIPAGQEKQITILCEKSLLYTCKYGSVEVAVENPESSTANNYVSQVAP